MQQIIPEIKRKRQVRKGVFRGEMKGKWELRQKAKRRTWLQARAKHLILFEIQGPAQRGLWCWIWVKEGTESQLSFYRTPEEVVVSLKESVFLTSSFPVMDFLGRMKAAQSCHMKDQLCNLPCVYTAA